MLIPTPFLTVGVRYLDDLPPMMSELFLKFRVNGENSRLLPQVH